MNNLSVENVYTRHKAKELTRAHFWKLLAMSLIVAVIVYAISFCGVMLLNIPVTATVSTSVSSHGSAATPANALSPVFVIGYLLLVLLGAFVGGGLSLGLTSAMIDLCRGKESVTVGRVFSRMRQTLKVFGLILWVDLKTILWALPGYVLTGVGFYLVLTTGNEMLTALLPLCSIILIFALVIPAYYRYMLSTYILADKPDTGVFACVNESKALMKGHKWQAFKLVVPTFLIMYVMLLLAMVVWGALIALLVDVSAALVVILTILFFVTILGLAMFYAIRIGLGYCLFYLKRQGESNAKDAAEPAEEPAPAE